MTTTRTRRTINSAFIIAVTAIGLLAATPAADAGGKPITQGIRGGSPVVEYGNRGGFDRGGNENYGQQSKWKFGGKKTKRGYRGGYGHDHCYDSDRAYRRGLRAGSRQGWENGYHDGNHGHGYDDRAPRVRGYGRAFAKGFKRGFKTAYHEGFDRARFECRVRGRGNRW